MIIHCQKTCKVIEACCLHLQGEDGGSMAFGNFGILPQHYAASRPRRPRLEREMLRVFGGQDRKGFWHEIKYIRGWMLAAGNEWCECRLVARCIISKFRCFPMRIQQDWHDWTELQISLLYFTYLNEMSRSRDSSVSTVTVLRAGLAAFDSRRGLEALFSSPPPPDRLWGHQVSYPMGTRGPFPGGKEAGAWSWPLTSS
jgi:hypothetical protein